LLFNYILHEVINSFILIIQLFLFAILIFIGYSHLYIMLILIYLLIHLLLSLINYFYSLEIISHPIIISISIILIANSSINHSSIVSLYSPLYLAISLLIFNDWVNLYITKSFLIIILSYSSSILIYLLYINFIHVSYLMNPSYLDILL
jgi:hypothetical protein